MSINDEDDFCFFILIQEMAKCKFSISQIYKTKFMIPDLIFFSFGGSVLSWYFIDKKYAIQKRTEDRQAFEDIYSYFNQNAINSDKCCLIKARSINNILFTCPINDLDDIINPNSYFDKKFRLNYIFNFFILKRSLGIFQASFLYNGKENSLSSISIESLPMTIINAKDYKDKKIKECVPQEIKSGMLISELSKVTQSVIQFFQKRLELKIKKIRIWFLEDVTNNFWIINIRDLESENNNQILSLKSAKVKCNGIHCNFEWNEELISDYNNELEKLYEWDKKNIKGLNLNLNLLQTEPKNIANPLFYKMQKIQLKSILIDKIEIEDMCTRNIGINNPKDPFNIIERKFFSLEDIIKKQRYHHLRLANYFDNVIICSKCFNYYSRLDYIRQGKIGKIHEIQKMEEEKRKQIVKKRLSMIINFVGTDVKTQTKTRNFHDLTSKKRSLKLIKKNSKDSANLPSSITQMPALYVDTKKGNTCVKVMESELLGIKHMIGHTGNLSNEDLLERQFLTKSSINLNKLADKLKKALRIPITLNYFKDKSHREDFQELKYRFFELKANKSPTNNRNGSNSKGTETKRSINSFTAAFEKFQNQKKASLFVAERKNLLSSFAPKIPNLKILASTKYVGSLDKGNVN